MNTMLRVVWLTLLAYMICGSILAEAATPLPPEKAFVFSAILKNNKQLTLKWDMAPGYYLYRQQLSFTPSSINDVKIGNIVLPRGEARKDIVHGHYQAYFGSLIVSVPLMNTEGQLSLVVKYQGCSSGGFCYAPFKKYVAVNMSQITAQPTVTNSLMTKQPTMLEQDYAEKLFDGHHLGFIIFSFLGLGLLLAFTPCILPMIPILSGIIVGHGKHISTSKAFCLSLAYVMGMALTYAAAGIVVALIGSSIQVIFQKTWVIVLFSMLFVLLALSLFGFYELQPPASWQQRVTGWSNRQKGGTYFGVFLMGVFSTLIVSPCVSAPLVGVLAYIGQTGDMLLGALALLALGLGMGIPLLLIGTSAGKLLPKTGKWMEAIKKLFGVFMLALAIWMLARVIPGPVALFLWAVLLICVAIFAGVFATAKSVWAKLSKGLGFVSLIYGVILITGAVLGNSDPLHPWEGVGIFRARLSSAPASSFTILKNMAQLNQQFILSKEQKKVVMIDFYADWCASCITIDRTVFSRPDVQAALKNFIVLRADVTQNNDFDQALLKRFHVIAPPTILFFNSGGKEIRRMVGEINAKEFLAHL